VDVDTGFWIWLAALPVMTTGYVVNVLASSAISRIRVLYPVVGLFAVVVCAVVVTFLVLMRSGYRWARTALTGGGVATVVYAVTRLFDADARPVTALISAVTGIVGSVLIAGGTFLLHRQDAQGYFTRFTR
jgi:preprotein translocase subunit SecG